MGGGGGGGGLAISVNDIHYSFTYMYTYITVILHGRQNRFGRSGGRRTNIFLK